MSSLRQLLQASTLAQCRRGEAPGLADRLGQAAGVVAALCAQEQTAPRALDPTRVQATLIAQGAELRK